MLLLASSVSANTFIFHFINGLAWFDNFYFPILPTLALSYGAIIPISNLGEIGPIVLIFSGLGTLAALIQIIALDSIKKAVQQDLRQFRKDIRTDFQDARK